MAQEFARDIGKRQMSVQMVIELKEKRSAQFILSAIEAYKARLRANISRTRRRLAAFEERYEVNTSHFLQTMTAEDLEGGDIEYVNWAGEAKLLAGLEEELAELEYALHRPTLPQLDHKHTSARIEPANAPTFGQVLDEILLLSDEL
jgi:hypothetical protein